jgi:hypothetical protein
MKGTPGSCQKELLQPPQPTQRSTRNQPSRGMEEKGKQTEGCQRESKGRKSLRNQLSKRREGKLGDPQYYPSVHTVRAVPVLSAVGARGLWRLLAGCKATH